MFVSAVLCALLSLTGCAGERTRSSGPPARVEGQSAPSVTQRLVQSASPAPATTTRTFSPYRGSTLRVASSRTVRGSCFTTSVAAPSARAYRCFAGNTILDPCFAPAGVSHPTSLACLADPWTRAVVLRPTAALPSAGAYRDAGRPWAIRLRNGARCTAVTGIATTVAGVAMAYRCTDGASAALGATTGRTVYARYAAPRASTLRRVVISTIWRG